MVTVVDYSPRKNQEGQEFFSLILSGGVTVIKSKQSGQFYITSQKCSVPSTFDEQTCKNLIGEKIPGSIRKQSCETYEVVDKDTGELIELSHRWEYLPEGKSELEAIFEGAPQAIVEQAVEI